MKGMILEVGFTIATLVTDIGTMVTGAATWIGTSVGIITNNALLLGVFVLGLGYTAIHFTKRLFRV